MGPGISPNLETLEERDFAEGYFDFSESL
jgi:hypothetical protein